MEILPIRELYNLETFEIECEFDTLTKILHKMHEAQFVLFRLKRISVCFQRF